MKTLYESVLDDNFESGVDLRVKIDNWIKKINTDNPNVAYWKKPSISDDVKVNSKGEITGRVIIENVKIPSFLTFASDADIELSSCTISSDLNIKDGASLTLSGCRFDKPRPKNKINLTNLWLHFYLDSCAGDIFDWVDNVTGTVKISQCPGIKTKFNHVNTLVIMGNNDGIEANKVDHLRINDEYDEDVARDLNRYNIKNVENVTIENCTGLNDLTGIPDITGSLTLTKLPQLLNLKGLEHTHVKSLTFDKCKNLEENDYLPSTLTEVIARGTKFPAWVPDTIKSKYPNIQTAKGPRATSVEKPDLDAKYRRGMFVATRTSMSGGWAYNPSRGHLLLDMIEKVTPRGINCRKTGFKKPIDFEIMDDKANPKKDWSYKHPKGIDDCTGVGLEVGDVIAVYCKSGAYGTNGGIELDEVVGFTSKLVKTKNNGNRPPKDICIIRPHEVAKEFFE